jgi:hypothetical protein
MAIAAFTIDIRISNETSQTAPGCQTFLEFLAAVPTAIIPFEAGGQQFSEFPHHANLPTNMEAAESPPFPHPSRRRRNFHR